MQSNLGGSTVDKQGGRHRRQAEACQTGKSKLNPLVEAAIHVQSRGVTARIFFLESSMVCKSTFRSVIDVVNTIVDSRVGMRLGKD